MKILLIEDDVETSAYVKRGLVEAGHVVDVASDGRDGLFMGSEGTYDVMVVDRMLPRMDGLSAVKVMRAAGTTTPVLFLTAMAGVGDRVAGLKAGGDDYLAKPFAFAELLARVEALARRPPLAPETVMLRVGDLVVDRLTRTVKRGDSEIELQPREFKLLEFLIRHAGQLVTRTMLLEGVWDYHFDPKTNVVETHISRLRSKLTAGGRADVIETIRGSGYLLRAPPTAA
mgnify:CR=1 FL=1